MTQEDKELLLKYLCMALPYMIIIKSVGENKIIGLWDLRDTDNLPLPYLRPMSSMTWKEKKEMHNLLSPEGTAIYENDGIAIPINYCRDFVPYEFMNRIIQYLVEHHFDFMGLIPKGLAIEVTKENNPYKE